MEAELERFQIPAEDIKVEYKVGGQWREATANAARSRALKALGTWEEKLHDANQDIQEIAARITAGNPFTGTAQVQEPVPVVPGEWTSEQEQEQVL